MKKIQNILQMMEHMMACVAMFVAILAVALFASCSKDDDELDQEGYDEETDVVLNLIPITFNSNIADEAQTTATRATTGSDAANTLGEKFIVYGYKTVEEALQTVFPGYNVQYSANTANSTTTNSSNWEYVDEANRQHVKYWDFGAYEYRFFGVTSTASNNPTVDTSSTTETDVTFTLDATSDDAINATPYFSDLWVKNSSDLTGSFKNAVQLSFRKPFCKVRIMFVDADGVEYDGVANPSFAPVEDADKNNLITKGTLMLKYPITRGSSSTYSWVTTKESTLTALTEAYTASNNKWYTLIPPTSQTGAYQLTATIEGASKTAAVPSELVQWKPGYSYTYMFKITETGELKLLNASQVAIKEWSNGGNTTHYVHNW